MKVVLPKSRIYLQFQARCGFCRRFNLSWRHKDTKAEYCFQHGLGYFHVGQLIALTKHADEYREYILGQSDRRPQP